MSPPPPTLNPSQTVERIREIIVGRHLERLEGRIKRLEKTTQRPKEDTGEPIIEDRLLIAEAKVEALQEHVQRIDGTREETIELAAIQRQEAQRLAAQIQEIARLKTNPTDVSEVDKLERKLGVWLTDWQKSMHSRLESRDLRMVEKLEASMAKFREEIEGRFSKIEAGTSFQASEKMEKIAEAARSLAEVAASFSKKNFQKV